MRAPRGLLALLLAGSAAMALAAPPAPPSRQDLAYQFFDAAERCYGKRDLSLIHI